MEHNDDSKFYQFPSHLSDFSGEWLKILFEAAYGEEKINLRF